MTSEIRFTRKELNHVAKLRGIKKPRNMSTEVLIDVPTKYDSKRKVENNRKKLSKMDLKKLVEYKIFQNISKNDLDRVIELQSKSIDELQAIATLSGFDRIRPDDLTKEDIIIILLKSESNPAEHNYMKCFNNRTSDDKKK